MVLFGLPWGIKIMTTYYYSPSKNAFYAFELKQDYLNAESWPDDATPISERLHHHLIGGQQGGKVIVPDEYGQPMLSDPEPPSQEQIVHEASVQKTALMQQANDTISPLQDAIDLDMATESEKQKLIEWKKYRVLLSRTNYNEPWPDKPTN